MSSASYMAFHIIGFGADVLGTKAAISGVALFTWPPLIGYWGSGLGGTAGYCHLESEMFGLPAGTPYFDSLLNRWISLSVEAGIGHWNRTLQLSLWRTSGKTWVEEPFPKMAVMTSGFLLGQFDHTVQMGKAKTNDPLFKNILKHYRDQGYV